MADTLLGVSSTFVIIRPELATTFGSNIEREDHRTREKALFTYIEPNNFDEWKLKLSWISSSDRSLVSSWQQTATDLTFIPDNDFPSSLHTVRIMGKKEPFNKFTAIPYGGFNAGSQVFFAGEIIIQTI
jgi:hypothetical protein